MDPQLEKAEAVTKRIRVADSDPVGSVYVDRIRIRSKRPDADPKPRSLPQNYCFDKNYLRGISCYTSTISF